MYPSFRGGSFEGVDVHPTCVSGRKSPSSPLTVLFVVGANPLVGVSSWGLEYFLEWAGGGKVDFRDVRCVFKKRNIRGAASYVDGEVLASCRLEIGDELDDVETLFRFGEEQKVEIGFDEKGVVDALCVDVQQGTCGKSCSNVSKHMMLLN